MSIQFLILIAIVLTFIAAAPFIISFRISKFGNAILNEPPLDRMVLTSCWVNIKGENTFTKQSMLCRLKLYSDRIGMKLLWGPEKFIKLSSFSKATRLLKGSRTTRIRLDPKDKTQLQPMIFTGIVDIPLFLNELNSRGKIELEETDDPKGPFDFFK